MFGCTHTSKQEIGHIVLAIYLQVNCLYCSVLLPLEWWNEHIQHKNLQQFLASKYGFVLQLS